MIKSYRTLGIALILGVVLLAAFVLSVGAQSYSPPYVIVLKPWSFNAKAAAVIPGEYAYVVAQKGVAIFKELELTNTIDIGSPVDIAADPVRGYVYVTRQGDSVSVLSGTQKLANAVNLGAWSAAVAVMTTTGYAYVALPDQGSVGIIRGTQEIATLKVGNRPSAIATDSANDYAYVVNRNSNSVTVIQGQQVSHTVTVGSNPLAVAVNPASGYAYVSNNSDDNVSVLQGGAVITTIQGITEPTGIAINQATNQVYVLTSDTSNPQSTKGWLSVISGTTLVDAVPLLAVPKAIGVNSQTGYTYVTIGAGETGAVTVMSNTLPLETFPMDQLAPDVAVDPILDMAYVPIYNGRVAVFGRTVVYATEPLGPGSGETQLHCQNTQSAQNLPITITIPAGAIHTENTRVLCIPLVEAESEPDYAWARQGFRLVVAQNDVHQPDYVFGHSLSADMTYLESLPAAVNEAELEFLGREWGGDQWLWYAEGIGFVDQDMSANHFVVTLDYPGDYALLDFKPHIYLPIVMRQ